jgi:hypothetical protein
MKETIVMFKQQTMDILRFRLEILPHLIPNNFVIFRYNRIVNFHDSNIINEIEKEQCHKWDIDDLFELLIKCLESLNFNCLIVDDKNEFKIKSVDYKKIKPCIIRKLMKNCPLWAINHNSIVNIPSTFLSKINKINFVKKNEYIAQLVEASYNIRSFLLQHEQRHNKKGRKFNR